MSNPVSRRKFIQKAAGIGLAFPLIGKGNFPYVTSGLMKRRQRGPVIATGRGEKWGEKVLKAAWDTLVETGDGMAAVIAGANVVELDPEDPTVGYGGLPNEEGVVQLDSSVMHGPTRNAGAVAALEEIKTPSRVARLVMERTDHVLLVGEGAQRFALAHGFKRENLLTEKARIRWLKWKENLSDEDDWFPPADESEYEEALREHGTINVLCLDEDGNLFGVTTTSGLAFKIPGRVGDSPIIGAGLYVDNDVGATGATGRGEAVIKICGSFLVVELMRQGMSPKRAVEEAGMRIIRNNNGKVNFGDNFLALNKEGEVYRGGIWGRKDEGGPPYALITKDGVDIRRGVYLQTYERRK
jgi:N4-(beta-N-acetylglucosaminyl)-L-asparaginase